MVEALVRAINERHGTAFVAGARFLDGQQGAYAVTEGDGRTRRHGVLKWFRGQSVPADAQAALAMVDRLRALGSPVPRYRLVGVAPASGVVYIIQDALPGVPLGGRLDDATLEQVLALNERQRGRAPAPGDWLPSLVRTALEGGDGFCLLEPMRRHGDATAALLAKLQRLVASHAGEPAPSGDIVHFDFQGSNILVEDGRISGGVDWEGSRVGDCTFDLVTLFFCQDGYDGPVDPVVVERLWRAICRRTTPALRRIYLAHMTHRQVDWAVRFLGPDLVVRNLRRADEVLCLLASTD